MMARSSTAPAIGRIQKRKTNFSQIIIFGLQRAAGPHRRATCRHHTALGSLWSFVLIWGLSYKTMFSKELWISSFPLYLI